MTEPNPFREVYALIWKSNEPVETFKQSEFDARIPRLMAWLQDLFAKGRLVGCGGGAFDKHAGGLTLINASGIDEAKELGKGSPMNEIGKTEIMVWDVFYGDLVGHKMIAQLK
jgi:hypothetical protein